MTGASYRARPLALDTGTSADAAATAGNETLGLVQTAVLRILREHPRTDEELVALYRERTAHPAYPRVTEQRIRTARAALTRLGRVRDSGQIGFTILQNRATIWEAVVDRAGGQ